MTTRDDHISLAIKRYYVFRIIAATFLLLINLAQLDWELSAGQWIYAGICFLYPHIAFFVVNACPHRKQAMFVNFYVDSFFFGSWAPIVSFSMWPLVAMFMTVVVNSISSRGVVFCVQNIACFISAAIISSLLFDLKFLFVSNMTATILGVVWVMLYSGIIGWTSFFLSEQIKEKRAQLKKLASKLAKYLSPQVYDSIFRGEKDVKIETYKKHLTVFFSDIAGFTTKTENTEISELTQWLNTYLNDMTTLAIKYNGTLDKFIGDAVMVFFGDPKTSGEKQDALKCISMAIEMKEHAKKLGVDIRMGVNTGDCIVGNFGSEQRMEYTILGPTVNLAARLESNSQPHQILISESTFALIKDEIVCEERGEICVKGIDRKIMTYWVVGHKTIPDNADI